MLAPFHGEAGRSSRRSHDGVACLPSPLFGKPCCLSTRAAVAGSALLVLSPGFIAALRAASEPPSRLLFLSIRSRAARACAAWDRSHAQRQREHGEDLPLVAWRGSATCLPAKGSKQRAAWVSLSLLLGSTLDEPSGHLKPAWLRLTPTAISV